MKNNFLFLIAFLGVLNLFGQEQVFDWTKSTGGNEEEVGYSVTTDPYGNVFVCGTFQGTVDFNPGSGVFNLTSNGTSDIFIQKLDSLGNFVWAKSIGGSYYDKANSIVYDGFNSIIITGKFVQTVDFDPSSSVFNLTTGGTFILKLSLNGDFEWAKTFDGYGQDEGHAVAVDGVGNVYVTGEFAGTSDFNPGPGVFNMVSVGFTPDIFILKLTSNGNFSWAVSIGGHSNDAGWGIGVDNANNIYVNGIFYGEVDFDPSTSVNNLTSLNSSWDMFVVKLGNSGNFLWAKSVGGIESIWPRGFTVDNSGDVIITGSFRGTVDFDPGNPINNMVSVADADAFVEKLSTTGDFVWAKSLGGSSRNEGRSVAIDSSNNIYLTGAYFGTVDFDPNASIYNLTSVNASASDVFIAKLDPLGDFIWAKSRGGSGDDFGQAIAVNQSADVFVTGAYKFTADFDPEGSSFPLTSNGGWDLFVQKLSVKDSTDNIDTTIVQQKNNITFYPNPTSSYLLINNLQKVNEFEVGIYSFNGRLVQYYKSLKSSTINVSTLEPGVYFISLKSKKVNVIKRFIIIN